MKKTILLAALALLTVPVSTVAQKVKVHYDRSINFAAFKTYSWIEGRPANNPASHLAIVQAIDKQLQSKGIQRVDGKADLNIAYYVSLDAKTDTSTVPYLQGLDWSRWGGEGVTYQTEVLAMPISSLLVDLVDASATKLIWRGSAKEAFTPNQATRKKLINSAAQKLFKNFPPPGR